MFAPELLGGRYELRGVLGRGGMAEVREGYDSQTAQIVAIKLLYPGFDSQSGLSAPVLGRGAVGGRVTASEHRHGLRRR